MTLRLLPRPFPLPQIPFASVRVHSGNEYADWVRTENEAYRASEIKRLAEEAIPDDYTTGLADANDLKTAKWRLATDVLAQTTKLESRIHAIERIPSEGRGKAAQFIPVRFVFRNKLTKGDKLLLAFDAVVLSELLGRPVTMGKIIHGDDHSTLKVKTATLTKPVGKLIEKSTALLSTYKPPDLVLNRHCGECEFQTRCREKAIEKDDLSLLAGMSEKERKKSGVRMAARIHRNLDAHRLLHGTRIHAPSVASLRGCPT